MTYREALRGHDIGDAMDRMIAKRADKQEQQREAGSSPTSARQQSVNDPSPMTMLLEGARDAIATLKLLRLGAIANVPMSEAFGMIDVTIDELQYAISAALDAKEAA